MTLRYDVQNGSKKRSITGTKIIKPNMQNHNVSSGLARFRVHACEVLVTQSETARHARRSYYLNPNPNVIEYVKTNSDIKTLTFVPNVIRVVSNTTLIGLCVDTDSKVYILI